MKTPGEKWSIYERSICWRSPTSSSPKMENFNEGWDLSLKKETNAPGVAHGRPMDDPREEKTYDGQTCFSTVCFILLQYISLHIYFPLKWNPSVSTERFP